MMDHAALTRWLIDAEQRFGGLVTNVPRGTVSPLDPRTPAQLTQGGMRGGDRMKEHGYAKYYAKYLAKFLGHRITLVEVGILQGTGLAVWSELFAPTSRIFGLDIDTEHFVKNSGHLAEMGAFRKGWPTIVKYDQLVYSPEFMGRILEGQKVDIYIDDGLHTDDAILTSFASIRPHLAKTAVCFIEDNTTAAAKLRMAYPDLVVHSHGQLTIVEHPA